MSDPQQTDGTQGQTDDQQDEQYRLPADDREALAEALGHVRGFLSVSGLTEAHTEASRIAEKLSEREPGALPLSAADAASATASLVSHRNHLLDEGEVQDAAAAEEALRSITAQDAELAQLADDLHSRTGPAGTEGER
jgi:hypothetical protein